MILPAQHSNQKRILNPKKRESSRIHLKWLEEETPIVEDVVQEVEEPAEEVAPVEAALHQMCPSGHQNSGPSKRNKGKDGDMLCTSNEKMATYISTKYGDEAAQELTSKKHIVSKEPKYSDAIEIRHAKRV